MRADREPVVMTVSLASERAIASADFGSINLTLFAEVQRRMAWVCLKQSEVLFRELLNVPKELVVTLSEGPQGV
jgi:hypothetical protein